MALGLSLPQFATALMRELRMAEHPTPVQLQILQYLASNTVDVTDRKSEVMGARKIVCGFRGVGKSTLTAITGLWWLDEDPNEKLLFLSASGGFAKKITTWMLTTIRTVDWLAHLRPDTKEGRYSNIEFDVGACTIIEQSPSVKAAGIYGQVTGSRASRVIVDDCETPQTCLTQLQRERLKAGIEEAESILKPGASDIIYLGTPHASIESIYFFLASARGYQMRMWPARVPKELKPYKGMLAPSILARVGKEVNAPTDTRFSHDELTRKQLGMSPSRWRLQFMLDASQTDEEKYQLKCRDLLITSLSGETLPEVCLYEKSPQYAITDLHCPGLGSDTTYYRPALVEGTIRAEDVPAILVLDPSGGGADEFAWCVLSAWGGNFYLRAMGGSKGGSSEELWMKLARTAKQYHVKRVLVESNFGGLAVWEQVGKPYFQKVGYPLAFEGIRTGGQRKELRMIDSIAPVVQVHALIVDRQVIEDDALILTESEDEKDIAYSFMYQFTRLTEARGALRHDDKLDVLALAIQFYQDQAAQDQEKRAADRRTEYLHAQIEDESGRALMNATRLAMGMTLEQAKRAAAGDATGSNWLSR